MKGKSTCAYPVRNGPDITMQTIDLATSSTLQWKFPEIKQKLVESKKSLRRLLMLETSYNNLDQYADDKKRWRGICA